MGWQKIKNHNDIAPIFFLPLLRTPRPPHPTTPEYNVGLALLRLGKVMSPASGSRTTLDNDAADDDTVPPPDSEAAAGKTIPAVDCRIARAEGSDQGGEARQCLPLVPPWWPVDLDPATGKVPA